MFDDGYQEVPAGLEELPVGAGLAAVLERIDPLRVSPYDTVRLVAAQHRQLAHQQACFHVAAREASLADPAAPGGRAELDVPAAGDELRAVLAASRTAVGRVLDLAEAAERHPRLGAAWQAGRVDEQRVAILVRRTAPLSQEHASEVIERLVDEAGSLTLSRLIDKVEALAKALDPEWAEKLYRRHRRQRRVRARCTEAGTVNISAMDLPLPGGVTTTRRIHALAARAQAAGHPGLIDTIRADTFLAVWDPAHAGASEEEIVAAVLAAALPDDPQPRRTPDPADAPPEDPPSTPSRRRRSTRQSRFELRVGLATLLRIDDRPARLPGWGVVPAGTARELAAAYGDAEWRVAVTDESGALIAALITRHRPSEATTTPQEPPIEGAPRPVVELHVPEAALDALRPGDFPGWARLLTDLQHQLACWRTARAEDRAAREAEQRAAEQRAAEERAAKEWAAEQRAAEDQTAEDRASELSPASECSAADAPGNPTAGLSPFGQTIGPDAAAWERIAARRRRRAREAVARFPSAALRRWITMRDRSCVFPPCGASALEAEIDHTLSVLERGLTVGSNLGPACGHDHDLKDQGWQLDQPRPGWFRWTSPTGHTYDRPPRPVVDDLPAAHPPAVRSSAEPHQYADDGPLWENDPYPRTPARAPAPETPPPTGRPPPPDDPDPPPF
ncbi:hypothetical protein EV188_101267 [Actinomycetospora succinea]|uniref:DUF222 domain-containing protein n=1 Tax=Actinomycetospora succinea TaxID=663603 RepID=A0A4V3DB32_9PSEU|nr:HNH endonuclease signature motif containing protein [Actinomycetospora succinea]TDQ65018.1 hypothetical protein EV188_101267 [Actinomycetospora succinea]